MEYKFIHGGQYHTDTSLNYLRSLGMDEETIEHVQGEKAEYATKERNKKLGKIKAQAEELYVQDVTDDDGNTWKGGEASANKIKGGVELAEFAGLTEFTVTDAKRKEHVMTINEAKTVAALIGADYQRKFLARQAAVRTLESLDCFAADALQQIANVKLEV